MYLNKHHMSSERTLKTKSFNNGNNVQVYQHYLNLGLGWKKNLILFISIAQYPH